MLLFDQNGHAQSVTPYDVTVPFVREWFGHDLTRVRAFLSRWPHDLAFVTAMVAELRRCLASPENNLPYPDGLIEAAMRAIAGGLIGVASLLPESPQIIFDPGLATAPYGTRAVMFASEAVAENFVAIAMRAGSDAGAFATCLAQAPMGRQRLAAGASNPADIARLLVTRHLALLPWNQSHRLLRIVWAEHAVPPAKPEQAAASPPPQAGSPSPQPDDTPPQSTLPDAPDDLSPQAQALIDAAQDGTPFCEECARRAAELADA